MYYIVESSKSFEQAATDLEEAVKRNQFGVLHIHDLGNTLRGKGIDFKENCRVFEVCNPVQANKVLSTDMRMNMALPCRISVYGSEGSYTLATMLPTEMMKVFGKPEIAPVAKEVEGVIIHMIQDAAGDS